MNVNHPTQGLAYNRPSISGDVIIEIVVIPSKRSWDMEKIQNPLSHTNVVRYQENFPGATLFVVRVEKRA